MPIKQIHSVVAGFVLLLVLLLFGQERRTGGPQSSGFRGVVDLTHSINAQVPAYEASVRPQFSAKTIATIAKDQYFARTICVPEHFGTHIDAPAHFIGGLWTVDQIPPERLIGPLVVMDVSANAKINPDYQISVEDISRWEHAHGQIPAGSIVITRTGWDARWNSAKAFRNPDKKGVMHFPGYSLDAAKFLVEGRNIFGLGIDTLSIDYGPSTDFPVHKYVLMHSIYQLEDVANLESAPAQGAVAVVAPMKLEGGSGSPVRILALLR